MVEVEVGEGEEEVVKVPRMAPIFDAPYTPSPTKDASKRGFFA